MLFFTLQVQRNSNEQYSLRRLQNDMLDYKLQELNDDKCEVSMKMDIDILQISMTPKIGCYRFKNYLFLLDFRINYPIFPPSIKTGSDTLHPNIDRRNSKFYLSLIEQENWKPIYGLSEIIKEMKQTLIHVDFKCIPNETSCLRMAQQILNQKDDENDNYNDIETIHFEISETFRNNFEINDNEQQHIQFQDDSTNILYQEPATINLQTTSKHCQNDNMFLIKIKK